MAGFEFKIVREYVVNISLILENNVQSVNDARNISENCQENVDEEISTASSLKEDTKRWENDGKNDLADIACGEGHVEFGEVMNLGKLE